MYPHERSLVKQLSDKPFAIIGVNSDSDLAKLQDTLKEENITWRSFQNEKGVNGKISTAWNIQGWPTVYILDQKGIIRFSGHQGDFDRIITELLAEMDVKVEIKHEDEKKLEKDADTSNE